MNTEIMHNKQKNLKLNDTTRAQFNALGVC